MTGAIQVRLLPANEPTLTGFEVTGASIPSREIGGDYFDFLAQGEDKIGIAIGDVSGKGMPAALLMSNLQASLHGQVLHQESVAGVVKNVNDLIVHSTDPHMFATFFYGLLDVSQATLTCTNAGHNPPLHLMADGSIEELTVGGLLLGMVGDQVYQQETVELAPGEVVVMYTDGITEAVGPGADEEDPESMFATLSVEDEIAFGPENLLFEKETIQRTVDELFELTGIGQYRRNLVWNLSGGQIQKLGLAAVLAMKPGVIILDEPTAGVDPVSRRELWAIIYRLVKQEGISVLLSTAYLDEAERCSRLALLDQGRVIARGSPAEVIATLEAESVVQFTLGSSGERSVVEVDPAAAAPLQLAVHACAGLHNRARGGSVYIQREAHDARWLAELDLAPDEVVTAADFLDACLARFPTCVRYAYADQQELLPSILTAAGYDVSTRFIPGDAESVIARTARVTPCVRVEPGQVAGGRITDLARKLIDTEKRQLMTRVGIAFIQNKRGFFLDPLPSTETTSARTGT